MKAAETQSAAKAKEELETLKKNLESTTTATAQKDTLVESLKMQVCQYCVDFVNLL
jgi:hypothetical protein